MEKIQHDFWLPLLLYFNIYYHIKEDYAKFDTFDYLPYNVDLIRLMNKKLLGLMKDENKGIIFLVFIGLRSKMYSIKGVKDSSIKSITYENYYQDNSLTKFTEQHLIFFLLGLKPYKG